MNRKAIFFTLMSILIIELVVMSYLISIDINYNGRIPTIQNRIKVADTYNKRIKESILDKLVKVGSYKAMQELLKEKSQYSNAEELNEYFTSIVFKGIIPGISSGITTIENVTLNSTLRKLTKVMNETFHIDVIFNPKKLEVFQSELTGPWLFAVNFSFDYFVGTNLGGWNTTNSSIIVTVPIIGLRDPLYLEHARTYEMFFKRSHSEHIVWNNETILNFTAKKIYRHEVKAPSFVQRLLGSVSNSTCCGVESFINPKDISSLGGHKDESYVDYCFFGKKCHTQDYDIYYRIYTVNQFVNGGPGIPSSYGKFKLDTYHMNLLGVNSSGEYCQYPEQDPYCKNMDPPAPCQTGSACEYQPS